MAPLQRTGKRTYVGQLENGLHPSVSRPNAEVEQNDSASDAETSHILPFMQGGSVNGTWKPPVMLCFTSHGEP